MKYVPTEKQNRNMKTKVLKYKFDGNTIVAPYMELEPYAENVFILKSATIIQYTIKGRFMNR
jgi:hypothetical protein